MRFPAQPSQQRWGCTPPRGGGAGAGERAPRGTGGRRGGGTRINDAAAVKPQVKNIFGFSFWLVWGREL